MTHVDDPIRLDASRLARILLQYIAPTDAHIRSFLWDASHDRFPGPIPLVQELKRELVRTRPPRWAPKSAVLSDAGIVRERNEDRWMWYAIDEGSCLFVCADGMGGHSDGHLAAEIASREVASYVIDHGAKSSSWDKLLREALASANKQLLQTRRQTDAVLATTIVVAVVEPGKVTVAHAGDCRAYLIRGHKLEQLTADHTIIAELIASGRIGPEEAKTHPSRNVVTSGLGLEDTFDLDVTTKKIQSGDRLLLCSDGLCSYVENDDILRIVLANETPADTVVAAVRAALAGGTTDNVTVMVAEAP